MPFSDAALELTCAAITTPIKSHFTLVDHQEIRTQVQRWSPANGPSHECRQHTKDVTQGAALIKELELNSSTWGVGNSANSSIREGEVSIERKVSEIIGGMRFLWLSIEDEPGPSSLRGYIEKNSIALLSNFNKPPLDPPSQNWLGHYSDRERVRKSGLWNQNHVDEAYDPTFLDTLERFVSGVRKAA